MGVAKEVYRRLSGISLRPAASFFYCDTDRTIPEGCLDRLSRLLTSG